MLGVKKYHKTKELILYIASRFELKVNYGSTLLNKCLYFIDNVSYLKARKPVSDLTYVKQTHGPTPEPGLLLSLRDALVSADDLEIREVEFFGRVQKRWIAKRKPNMEKFSKEEILLIDNIIANVEDLTGSQVSEFSHQFPAWQAAVDREELPFYTFLLSSKNPSANDIDWAKAAIQ